MSYLKLGSPQFLFNWLVLLLMLMLSSTYLPTYLNISFFIFKDNIQVHCTPISNGR